MMTKNGGKTWNRKNPHTNQDIESVYFYDLKDGYIVTSSGIMLKTYNGGRSWHKVYKPIF